ncbi:MAG: Flp family type IVb pilin [Dongiaceae bacterium]
MCDLIRFLDRLVKDESGATLVEYTLLVGLISIAVVAILIALRGPLSVIWTGVQTSLSNASAAT